LIKFKEFIAEDRNLHMTHLTDAVINGGVKGTRQAINYLRALRDMLGGDTQAAINVSVKWDGAPSVFAGIDPTDGKFFIAKKSIFNKNPKVYKTTADIDADTSGDLNAKLKLGLAEFSKLGIKGVIQGDFLFSSDDVKTEIIDGEEYVTFHPNTISYAVPADSELAKTILASKLGVVWHTVYSGDSFENMKASFGEDIVNKLTTTKSVWAIDAVFKDVSGSATFTKAETNAITKTISDAGKIFASLPASTLNSFSDNKDLNQRVNAFINTKVRANDKIDNLDKFIKDLVKYIEDYYQKEADKKKTEKGKQSSYDKRDEILVYFNTNDIAKVFELYNLIDTAKHMVIDKLNKVEGLRTFLKTKNGYEVTGQEGFVAIDKMGKNALKLVDRLSFSRANFSPEFQKGWQR